MPPVFSSVKRKKQKRKKKGSLSTLDNTSNEEVFIITSAFRPFPDLFSIHLIARGGEAGQLRSLQQRGFSTPSPPPLSQTTLSLHAASCIRFFLIEVHAPSRMTFSQTSAPCALGCEED